MDKLRLLFTKTGRAVYVSHLDMMRILPRAFHRAELRLQYSEGFNPHPCISIALPLSVGTESVCELLDFKLAEEVLPDELLSRLSVQLPEGIEARSVYVPERKVKELKWLSICGVLEYDHMRAGDILPELTEFLSRDSIVIRKKTKRGEGESDIRPAIREIELTASGDDRITLNAVISAQDPTLNPELLADALRQLCPELAPDFAKFKRLEIFDENMSVFR